MLMSGAIVVLCCCQLSLSTADRIWVHTAGEVVTARVVAVRYDTKADHVIVLLPEPASQESSLLDWTGRPAVGDVLEVKYVPSRPALAVDNRSGFPRWRLALLGLGILLLGVVCSAYIGRYRASRRDGSSDL